MFTTCVPFTLVPKLCFRSAGKRTSGAGALTLSSLVDAQVLLKARGAHLAGGSTGLYSVSPADTWEILRVEPHSRRENCPDRT